MRANQIGSSVTCRKRMRCTRFRLSVLVGFLTVACASERSADSGGETGSDGSESVTTGGDTEDPGDTGTADASGATTSAGPSGATVTDDSGATTSDPSGAPQILSLTTNITTVGPGDTVVFSVVVTDPDGVDDVIGGQLMTEDRGATYGTFQTNAQEGAYSLALSLAEIVAVEPSLVEEAPISRSFRAEFFDQAGASVSGTVELSLRCTADGDLLCSGGCNPGECHPLFAICARGQGCFRSSDHSFFCDDRGNGAEGEYCDFSQACGAGRWCISNACRTVCLLGLVECPAGSSCLSLGRSGDATACGTLGYCTPD